MRTWRVDYKLQTIEAGGRSPGLHVSDIIRNLALKSGVLDKRYADNVRCGCGQVISELEILNHKCNLKHKAEAVKNLNAEKVELGCAWEDRLTKHHPGICFHPFELVVEGIPMTVDGLSLNPVGDPTIFTVTGSDGALHEFKLTWKSSRKPPEEDWMWMAQDKSYIYGVNKSGTLNTLTVFQHVYYVNGNYSHGPDGGPEYVIFGIEFTPTEIRENWSMIQGHKSRMEGKPLQRVSTKVRK